MQNSDISLNLKCKIIYFLSYHSHFVTDLCIQAHYVNEGYSYHLLRPLGHLATVRHLYQFWKQNCILLNFYKKISEKFLIPSRSNVVLYHVPKSSDHRVIHLSTHVYLSTKFNYLSYHLLHLLLYHTYLSTKVTYLSYHSLHLIYHISYTLIYLNIP